MNEHFFSDDEIAVDPILVFFDFEHLPEHLQNISIVFAAAVTRLLGNLPRSAERTMAFRKLLEAKDCAVRAAL